jgi:hypothetical protein
MIHLIQTLTYISISTITPSIINNIATMTLSTYLLISDYTNNIHIIEQSQVVNSIENILKTILITQ